jgi:hypothetical protein
MKWFHTLCIGLLITTAQSALAQGTTHINWQSTYAATANKLSGDLLLSTAGTYRYVVEYDNSNQPRITTFNAAGTQLYQFVVLADAFVSTNTITSLRTYVLDDNSVMLMYTADTASMCISYSYAGNLNWKKVYLQGAQSSDGIHCLANNSIYVAITDTVQQFWGIHLQPVLLRLDKITGDSLSSFALPDSSYIQGAAYYDDRVLGIDAHNSGEVWLWYKRLDQATSGGNRFAHLSAAMDLVKDVPSTISCNVDELLGKPSFVQRDSTIYCAYATCNTAQAVRIDTASGSSIWFNSLANGSSTIEPVWAQVTGDAIIFCLNYYSGIIVGGQSTKSALTPYIVKLNAVTGAVAWAKDYYLQSGSTADLGIYGIRAADVCSNGQQIAFLNTSKINNAIYAYINSVDITTGNMLWYDSIQMLASSDYRLAYDDACQVHVVYERPVDELVVEQYDASAGFELGMATSQGPGSTLIVGNNGNNITVRTHAASACKVVNMQGATVGVAVSDAFGYCSFNTSNYSAGIYLLNSNGGGSQKFVVQ